MENIVRSRSSALQCSTLPRAAHDWFNCRVVPLRKASLRKSLVLVAALASLGIALQAPAANQQQERMKACNAQAKSQTLSSAERKDFMKRCLSGQDAASSAGLNSQQRRMKSCNAEANLHGLKGVSRKRFMSTCLKSPS